MKLVRSSFFVGFITAYSINFQVNEKLLERRFLLRASNQTSEEELDAIRYQKVKYFAVVTNLN